MHLAKSLHITDYSFNSVIFFYSSINRIGNIAFGTSKERCHRFSLCFMSFSVCIVLKEEKLTTANVVVKIVVLLNSDITCKCERKHKKLAVWNKIEHFHTYTLTHTTVCTRPAKNTHTQNMSKKHGEPNLQKDSCVVVCISNIRSANNISFSGTRSEHTHTRRECEWVG